MALSGLEARVGNWALAVMGKIGLPEDASALVLAKVPEALLLWTLLSCHTAEREVEEVNRWLISVVHAEADRAQRPGVTAATAGWAFAARRVRSAPTLR